MTIYMETYSDSCADIIHSVVSESDVNIKIMSDEETLRCADLYESVVLLLESPTWLAMGGAAMGIVGAEIVKDVYKKIKLIASNLFQHFKPAFNQNGIEIHLLPRSRDKGEIGSIRIRYFSRTGEESDTFPFDPEQVKAAFDVYEQIVSPVIEYWTQRADIKSAIAHAEIGPGIDNPNWKLLLSSSDENNISLVTEILIKP